MEIITVKKIVVQNYKTLVRHKKKSAKKFLTDFNY